MNPVVEQNVLSDPNSGSTAAPQNPHPEWAHLIPDQEWAVYQSAMAGLQTGEIRFLLGGAFGLAAYTGRWRNTKDIDFFLLPEQRARAIDILSSAGFKDYYDTLAYDRGWIYRATRDGVIVDLIWDTPNRRSEVDELWFEGAPVVQLHDRVLQVVRPEELVWIKLYVLQRDRCDWPDVVNLLDVTSSTLKWERLVQRLGDDAPLLYGALSVFAWLCPDQVGRIPAGLRRRAGVRIQRRAAKGPNEERVKLLDSRPWFAALQPSDRPMRL